MLAGTLSLKRTDFKKSVVDAAEIKVILGNDDAEKLTALLNDVAQTIGNTQVQGSCRARFERSLTGSRDLIRDIETHLAKCPAGDPMPWHGRITWDAQAIRDLSVLGKYHLSEE